jgi:hypothetical protein
MVRAGEPLIATLQLTTTKLWVEEASSRPGVGTILHSYIWCSVSSLPNEPLTTGDWSAFRNRISGCTYRDALHRL